MQREKIAKLLAEARRHASEGAQRIAHQKRIVATLKQAGQDARMASILLDSLVALQATAAKRCVWLQRQLHDIDARLPQTPKSAKLKDVSSSDGEGKTVSSPARPPTGPAAG